MRRDRDTVSKRERRKLGAELFNYTWSLLDRKPRTTEENDEMLHAAHASRYHWGHAGGALQRSIGDWQISRVYASLRRPEPATHHGRRALQLAQRAGLAPFYVAYGHEAIARANAVAGNRRGRDAHLRSARSMGEKIRSADDRRMLEDDLKTIR